METLVPECQLHILRNTASQISITPAIGGI